MLNKPPLVLEFWALNTFCATLKSWEWTSPVTITTGPLQNEYQMLMMTTTIQDNDSVSCGLPYEPRTLSVGSHTPTQGLVGQGFLSVPHMSLNLPASRNYHWVPYLHSWENDKNFVTLPLYFQKLGSNLLWGNDSEHWKRGIVLFL